MPPVQQPGSPAPSGAKRRLFVFYHYLFPDNVVSAVLMDELSQGLVERGWQVTAFPANRGCRDEGLTYPPRETHKGVHLHRLWRPRFRQASAHGRLLNAIWMIVCWSLLALRPNPPDAIVVGTDPILSVTVAFAWKLLRPRTRIVHWCFDLYPEAAYADGLLAPAGFAARTVEAILHHAYAACDAIVDIGPCMRRRLARYRPKTAAQAAVAQTIVPWALKEPAAVLPLAREDRQQIFGDAQLAMLYSGSFGRAHTYEDFLSLAGRLRGESAMLAFSVRGNREQELRDALQAVAPASACALACVPFAPTEGLLNRLAAPDVHLLSLAPGWSGTVVPSKFFGALAAGRPVLYNGNSDSSVAQWIREHRIGWHLTPETVEATADDLLAYVNDPARVHAMRQRCLATYQAEFSRQSSIDRMHALLLDLVAASDPPVPASSTP